MRRVYIIAAATALLVLLGFGAFYTVWKEKPGAGVTKVGFIYDSDESTPYTYNFMLAQRALERELQEDVKVYTRSNVPEDESMEPIQKLVRAGCEIIFTNNYSPQVAEAAREYPQVQFCQSSFSSADHGDYPENYHTFNGAIYQARYVSGIAAGLKLRDMIDSHVLSADGALVGYVGAYPTVEVISGYTAFILGVRSVAPEATLRVRYTGTWSSYSREKACAKALIEEGCAVICQHSDTIGPAMACEEAVASRPIIHVGYNQDMLDCAPSASLISARVNWAPYVIGAVEALRAGERIERVVGGTVHGNDVTGGFAEGWVQLTELNRKLAAYGTQEKLDKAVEAFARGGAEVFKGPYTGVNPSDPGDTVDLKDGYRENEEGSWPTFGYVLDGIVTVED